MAASLVGGAFLSATLQVVFDRLSSHDVVSYLRGKKLNDELINNLKTVLSAVNAVLDDAEDKQITNPNVKQWLGELEDASYDADDLLDEIATDVLQSKLEAGSGTSNTSKSIINFFSSSLNIYDRKMKNKLDKILKRLKFLEERIYVLGLIKGVAEKPLPRPPTTSLIEEAEVFGRDGDKEAIIKLLLTDDSGGNKIGVIPIKGMGGVGKTTLAQLVYNHDQVKEHFELKVWVCVSEEFDIYKVTKTILSAVANSESYDNTDLDSLQIKLKELLVGKKFLIVLDDVWNENYVKWENMCKPFKNGAQGSKILVTTRNESVAQIMRTVPTHNLEHLKDEDCWQLFQKHAFPNENFTAHPALEIIGRKIVKKCKGLPLAAKTLGGLLRSTVNVEKWERISESEIWDLSDNESNILPALRLGYHYLPSHLKRCFAFCSIFPKGYRFQKHELVLLWMAENFVQQSKINKRMEDVGDEYFNELVSRSFFQRSSNEIESCFFMHDLIHDLAKYVSRNYCVTLAAGNSEEALMVKVRHLAIGRSTPIARFDSIFEAACLRTLLPTHTFSFDYISGEVVNHVILKLKFLRVLSLSGCRKLKQLPESIGEQRHLRHLDLSGTLIERLPESVCMLYNLQTLKLSSCSNLIELPKDIHHLINLRLLDIRWCDKLEKMPRHVSKLKSLQTLSTFIVGRDNAAKIGELRELQDLHGRLSLLKLNNVARAKDALEAKLMDKKYLEELDLAWKGDTNDSKHDREVLENLSPHTKLKRLFVYGYGGTTFPNWLGDHSFYNIVFIMLSNCKYCNCLPPLGQLPSLKTLYIEQLSGVVSVGAEFYGSSERKPFASLKFLSFSKMSNWEEWSSIEVEDGEVFPKLQELEIRECHRLMNVHWPRSLPRLTELRIFGKVLVPSLPSTPAIRKLELGKCEKLQLQEVPQTVEWFTIGGSHGVELFTDILRKSQTCHHLQHLGIHNCSSLVTFPTACLPTTLTELVVYFCEKLEFPMHHSLKTSSIQKVFIINSFGGSGSLKFFPLDFIPNLKDLVIKGCKNLESLTLSDRQLCQNLTTLTIGGPNFISFPKEGLHAPNLISLGVTGCKKLKMLPEQMHNLLPSLQELYISDCPELESFPEGGLPSNLSRLDVRKCSKLTAERRKWNLQTLQALTRFAIEDHEGSGVESFPEEGLLPCNLTCLHIFGLKSLNRLDIKGLQQLTSLTTLIIQHCPQLYKLPEEGLPTSLTSLSISECPILKQRCQMEKVSEIHLIEIDDN